MESMLSGRQIAIPQSHLLTHVTSSSVFDPAPLSSVLYLIPRRLRNPPAMPSLSDLHDGPFGPDRYDHDDSTHLHGSMITANGSLYFNEDSMWQNSGASAASLRSATHTPLFSPRYNEFHTPSSETSGLEPEHHHYSPQQELASISSYHNSSPALSTTPFESLLATPETIPSDAQIMAHISHNQNNEGISHDRPGRPAVCVDTSLLFSSHADYRDNNTLPPVQDLSPGLLSPYSTTHEIGPPLQSLSRRHSHTRSAEDAQFFTIKSEFPNSGRERGLQRVRSAPTSRQHSPYKRPKVLPDVTGNTRSISPGEYEDQKANGSGMYYPAKAEPSASPSPSSGSVGRSVVATDRIRAASTARRQNPAICRCNECGHTFTTNFAKDRHMNSHTGERRYPCTKPGCSQRFPTDSGRKRHEKSKTLHAS